MLQTAIWSKQKNEFECKINRHVNSACFCRDVKTCGRERFRALQKRVAFFFCFAASCGHGDLSLLLYYSIHLTFYFWKFVRHLFLCFFSFKIEHLLQQFGAARFEFYCGQERDIVITLPPRKKYDCAYFGRESVCAYLWEMGMLQCIRRHPTSFASWNWSPAASLWWNCWCAAWRARVITPGVLLRPRFALAPWFASHNCCAQLHLFFSFYAAK